MLLQFTDAYKRDQATFSVFVKRKREDYIHVKGEYQGTLQKLKHYLRRENKVNENKVSLYCETLGYM